MYTGLLHTHNLFRWLVLLILIIAIIFSLSGWLGKKNWNKKDNLTTLLTVIFMDIQFLTGMVLYAFVSPITKAAFANFGAAMKNADLRFYAVEHILLMVVALAFVHIGRSKTKKTHRAWEKHRAAAIWFGLGLVLILAGIPWNKALI